MKFVVFDLEDTLIDTKKAKNSAIERFFYEYKFNVSTTLSEFIKKWKELAEYYHSLYEKNLISHSEQRKQRMEDLFKFYNITTKKDGIELYDEYLILFEQSWSIFDDVLPTLEYLKQNGFVLGVISNGDLSEQINSCKKTKIIDYFKFIHTSSEFGVAKPNPELFKKVLNLHGIDFNDILFVGNSYSKDYLPCKELGIKTLLIDRNGKCDKLSKTEKISKLTDLISLV